MNHIKCPSRKSWLRTAILIFTRIIVMIFLLRAFKSLPDDVRTLINIGGWIGFSALMGVWGHLNSVFRRQTKLWKIQPKSIAEAISALKISLISDLAAIAFGLTLFAIAFGLKLSPKGAETFLASTLWLTFVIWFFSIPVLYEKALIKQKKKKQYLQK